MFLLSSACFAFSACAPGPANTPNGTNTANANASPATQNLTVVDRPQKIKDQMTARGEQDQAAPTLKIVSPANGLTIQNSTVSVKLELSGDLKGYQPHKDPQTGMGSHIHVILDNEPYEAYYDLNQPFELRNVGDGDHTLRVFASRPWHESYKNDGSFQIVKFAVRGGNSNSNQPATTNSGQQMSNGDSNRSTTPTPEGKTYPAKQAQNIDVDPAKPLLTYSRPKGEYKGDDAQAIMIDFWLSNAKLAGDGGEYRVRYTVDSAAPQFIDKWGPIWLSGWTPGKHTVKVELVDKNGSLIDNGGYNSTTREITVTP